jgi:hypothetical protein
MEKEQWINQVLDSTNGMKKATPSPFLFARIEQKIRRQAPKIVPYNITMGIAVLFVLLVSLNIGALNRPKHTQTNTSQNLLQMGFADDNNLYQ